MDSTDNQEAESRSTYEVVTMPSRFAQSQGKGFIDVYWLYDDGGEKGGGRGWSDCVLGSKCQWVVCWPLPLVAGLSLLLPHLLTQDNKWKSCKLRIFTAGSPQQIDSAALRYRQPSCHDSTIQLMPEYTYVALPLSPPSPSPSPLSFWAFSE